jgi:hypothetical protein
MPDHSADLDEKPLTAEQQKVVAKVRWLMLLSGLATMLGIAVVIGVIGFRMYRSGDQPMAAGDVTATLPKGAKVIGTAVAEGRIAVTIDNSGTVEVRTFDLRTLRPTGRLRFSPEP